MFLYQFLDMQNLALAPVNTFAQAALSALQSTPVLNEAHDHVLRTLQAQIKMIERTTRSYKRPSFNIDSVKFRGTTIRVKDKILDKMPFCELRHFERECSDPNVAEHLVNDPKVLIITPMSGHFATLMRGTVEAMLPSHDVTITDWIDAKMVPLQDGYFDLEDQIEYLMRIIRAMGPDTHILAISQASVTALCAVALLASEDNKRQPQSLTLIGGPIDARNQTVAITESASTHSLSWFRTAQIQMVPPYYSGAFRRVYPGIMQLLDRMSMTLDRHVTEQTKYYQHLVHGDGDAAEVHEKFYDEFLAVMDVPEEFYLQYVERAYQRHDLANGSFVFRSQRVDLSQITQTALLTVEGELDDLSPAGHTRAAVDLCTNIPAEKKRAHLEIGVGHYGIFNGRKWRNNIQPIIHEFIRAHIRS